MSGVTTMRVLGDGYYSLKLRDDIAGGDITGPHIVTAGLHVNGPDGYVSGGLASRLDPADRAESALELTSFDEIEDLMEGHIARGVDVIKIATTHGSFGFADAEPDLPEEWVREIVRVSHNHGLKVTAHSYGDDGDWAAIRGGVDGIEHLVNVPHELPDDMVQAIVSQGIWVTPTLAGSAYSVMTLLRDPDLLHRDNGIIRHVDPSARRRLYWVLRLLRLPGVARVLLRQPQAMSKLETWYDHSLANTMKLHAAGVKLAFGTDAPFTFGNFHHSVMNEARALQAAGLSNDAILRMATVGSAAALGIIDRVGTLEPGMRADCILIDGDPLADLEALDRVTLVIKDGRISFAAPTTNSAELI
jgi:imidazolonepropionase-like amidohydrolase